MTLLHNLTREHIEELAIELYPEGRVVGNEFVFGDKKGLRIPLEGHHKGMVNNFYDD